VTKADVKKLRIIALAVSISAAIPIDAQTPDSLFTIRGGTYAGQSVRLDPGLASRRSSRFLRVSRLKGETRYVGWNPSRLPAAVAFRGDEVTEADSAAFWSILRQMENDLGIRLFEPAVLSAESDPDDVIIVEEKSLPNADGLTMVTWTAGGALYDARVYLRSTSTLRNPRIVAHEMMHALGFGHTSAWTSIMNSGASAPSRLTLQDVAYAQFAMESRARSERSDMWERLALASEREPSLQPRDPYEACIFSIDRLSGLPEPGQGAPATVDLPRSALCSR
jgi:hypothetical protein